MPPPGVGFVTVTGGVLTVVKSLLGIAAFNCVELTNVVVVAAPLKLTTDPFTKFVPFTVSENPAEPTVAVFGESELNVGTGFDDDDAVSAVVPETSEP